MISFLRLKKLVVFMIFATRHIHNPSISIFKYIANMINRLCMCVYEVVVDASELKREEIVNCGMQFVGNRYVWGGIDPNKGADCSGFTMYIMREIAGITLSHSSRAQANEGRVISADEMRPGDLVFYGSGKRINHVAIYAGDGMIVHASNEEDGIKTSPWNYRKPIKIVNVLGD